MYIHMHTAHLSVTVAIAGIYRLETAIVCFPAKLLLVVRSDLAH